MCAPDNSNPVSSGSGGIPGGLPPNLPTENYGAYKAGGGPTTGWASFDKWLGPAGAKTFKTNLCNGINQQIQKDKASTQKAAQRLKDSIEGKDPDDSN